MEKQIFLERAMKVHGNKYDYSNVPNMFKANDKIEIICPNHGIFLQSAKCHLRGQGCAKCYYEKAALQNSWSKEKFIEEARKVHGDYYGYDKVVYVNQATNVIITCPKHGDFEQTPRKHLMGSGCKICGYEKNREFFRRPLNEVIEKAKKIHDNKYSYVMDFSYLNGASKMHIVCPIHGDFWQQIDGHLGGQGCPKCGREEAHNKKRRDKDYFIDRARKIHDNLYSYENFDYVNWHTKGFVTCPKHGDFAVTPSNHIGNASGCPKCVRQISKWEQEICDYLTMIGIECEQSNRTILDGKEIDIFLPQYNVGIECDGLLWHNELHKDKDYHLKKTEECKEHGIRLIHIFEDEWANKGEILKSMLLNLFGKTKNKIYARKCEIREVSSKDARNFLDENHIQGYSNSKVNYGLYYSDELVSLMTFGIPRLNLGGKKEDGFYELVRFCNKINTNVIGGASKLFKHFIKEYNPKEVVSYSDKRWSLGLLYMILGFTHDHDSKPNYFYVDGLSRLNRFGFRKSVLVNEGFDKKKTEHEIMLERGIYRIYDCGTMVWKWKC